MVQIDACIYLLIVAEIAQIKLAYSRDGVCVFGITRLQNYFCLA